jgi:hypothetical protein
MTKQLTLISLPDPDTTAAPEEQAASPAPGARHLRRTTSTTRSPRSTGPGRSGATGRSSGHPGWLDRRTIESGRQGLAAARAALADATRRAHERDEEREARRIQELARQADVIRHPAARRHAA